MEKEETYEQYIHRMTGTSGKMFTPTGWLSVQKFRYRNKKMLLIQCYTDCIYKKGQPIAKFWISPTDSVWLAWQLLNQSQIWNAKRRKNMVKELLKENEI